MGNAEPVSAANLMQGNISHVTADLIITAPCNARRELHANASCGVDARGRAVY
jgi:hypothetical protein